MDNVVYGMINYGNETISDGAKGSFEYIRQDISDLRKRYIALGFHLQEFASNNYYKEYGFSSMEEFVYKNFGIEKSSYSRLMSVYHRFAARGEGFVAPSYKIYVKPDFEEYSYTQLCEMVSIPESQLSHINPKMTCKEIREYKKSLKNKKSCVDATNEKVKEKVLTKQEKCASTPPLPEPDVQRPFDERYQLTTGRDLFVDVLDCLKNNIKNVDKVQAIIKLINDCGL